MKFESDIKFIIGKDILEQMISCVKKATPNEACGLVFGGIKEVKVNEKLQYHYRCHRFNCIESDKKSTVAFLVENIEDYFKNIVEVKEKYNLRLISIFHSHPAGCHPSGTDLYNMEFLDSFINPLFKNQIWTIMDGNNYDINGFIYFHKELMQIDLIREK